MVYLVDDYSVVFPFDNEICVDFDCEIPVLDFQDFEIVKADGDVHWSITLGVQWWNIPGEKRSNDQKQFLVIDLAT